MLAAEEILGGGGMWELIKEKKRPDLFSINASIWTNIGACVNKQSNSTHFTTQAEVHQPAAILHAAQRTFVS